ncbi:MAG: BirA family biotin operon repressor/biotin-[acetyl-CoA-carboxylase] ligase [Desulforhopalus sp.]|jgi:BirA family biotin operon repressor/biotin-[acetyl-CoA-carboxylase] ligase
MVNNNPSPEMVLHYLRAQQVQHSSQSSHSSTSQEIFRYGAFIGANIQTHSSLPRAMEYGRGLILDLAKKNRSIESGTVILADSMTHSKGRFTRSWHAPLGGVWGCLIHGNNVLPESRQFIPMAVGLACCEAVREYVGKEATLRWVNDVLVRGKKLAGFLVESYTEPVHGEEFTMVGFGINVNNSTFPQELEGLALSLRQHLGHPVDLADFTARFLGKLAWNFGLIYKEEAESLAGKGFSGTDGLHLILSRWKELSDTIGKDVVYGFDVMTAPQYNGQVVGVDETGGLIIRLDDGFEKTEYSGEVRYRK